MRILAFDPGGVTGWSLFVTTPKHTLERVDFGRCGPHEHHAELEMNVLTPCLPLDLIIYERFEHRNNDFSVLVSLEYIGVIKSFAQKHSIELVAQGSSQAKRFAVDMKIRRLGWMLAPKREMKDVVDSERHMVFWVCNNNAAPPAVRFWCLSIVSPR